jgi:hypothetical protein
LPDLTYLYFSLDVIYRVLDCPLNESTAQFKCINRRVIFDWHRKKNPIKDLVKDKAHRKRQLAVQHIF